MGYSIRTERHRYVEWMNWETREYVAYELYDHHRDPGEKTNLAGLSESRQLLRELAEKLEVGWKAARPADGR